MQREAFGPRVGSVNPYSPASSRDEQALPMHGMVFVSYSRADSDFALKLARDLRSAGIEIWIDQLDIHPGDPWDQVVEKALTGCSSVLVILSPESCTSSSVMDEVAYALDEGKRLVPVLYRPSRIPLRLRRLQHMDFTSDYAVGLSQLAAALGASVPEEAHRPSGESSAEPASPAVAGSRLRGAAWAGLGGAAYGTLSTFLLYRNDVRVVSLHAISLLPAVGMGMLLAGFLWAAAGAIAGMQKGRLLWAVAASIAATLVWVLVGGTDVDVLQGAIVCGGPLGGIVGALIGRAVSKR